MSVVEEFDSLDDDVHSFVCSVFISFAPPQDTEFVRRLHRELSVHGRKLFVDFDGLSTQELREATKKGIESSDVFLFVLSADSIESNQCLMEFDHAVRCSKRIVVVVPRPREGNASLFTSKRHELSSLDWKFFNEDYSDFDAAFKLLLKAIDRDLRHARYHTKLLMRAFYWESHDFEKSLLLSGDDLTRAQHWLSASVLGKEPKPSNIHISFVSASAKLTASMTKRKLIAFFYAAMLAIVLLWPSWGVFFFSLFFTHFFVYFSTN